MSAEETRAVIVNAWWKNCFHGGGWWIAKDADGNPIMLAPDGFVDELPRTDLLPPRALAGEAGPWQSVDSAPEDGTEFVACLGPTGFTEYAIMMWNDDEDDWTDTSGAIIGVPDRWTPIPALATCSASPDTRVVTVEYLEEWFTALIDGSDDERHEACSEIRAIIEGGQDRG